jgi:small subunit ribosomal protein S6
MAQREYEFTVIIRANLPAEDQKRIETKVEEYIAAGKGTILHALNWGKRNLAYPIEDETRGMYLYYDFIADGTVIKEVERFCRLDEQVLRFLTVMLNAEPSLEVRRGEKEQDLKRLEQYLGLSLLPKDTPPTEAPATETAPAATPA